MREIKFRAWDSHNKVMLIYPLENLARGEFTYDEEIGSVKGQPIQSGFRNFEWMQYTGLKDKNGVEIYEGDTVTIEGDGFKHTCWLQETDKIMFAELVVELLRFKIGRRAQWEVIGNIYENPELVGES